jgi:hypothetical protein
MFIRIYFICITSNIIVQTQRAFALLGSHLTTQRAFDARWLGRRRVLDPIYTDADEAQMSGAKKNGGTDVPSKGPDRERPGKTLHAKGNGDGNKSGGMEELLEEIDVELGHLKEGIGSRA